MPRPAVTLRMSFLHHIVPLFAASLNGRPARMLLDTGAGISALTPATVRAAHLPVVPGHVLTLSGPAGSVKVPLVAVRDFRLGSSFSLPVGFADVDLFGAWHRAVLGAVSGTLGADILSHYDIDLDFPRNRVVLFANPCGAQGRPWAGATPVRFRLLRGGQIVLPVTLDGRRVSALLDTGSSLDDMPRSLFQASGLAQTAPIYLFSTTGHGIGARTYKSELYRFRKLTIGGENLRDPIFSVGGLAVGGPYAIIGENFILRHEIFVSYPTRTLYVRGP
ncbi:MAG TPA: aspartyl protease family protein [Acetobacteraceae bacterium]|nr:aspartyl protease family protein [Acetobacteraceae bacterium]